MEIFFMKTAHQHYVQTESQKNIQTQYCLNNRKEAVRFCQNRLQKYPLLEMIQHSQGLIPPSHLCEIFRLLSFVFHATVLTSKLGVSSLNHRKQKNQMYCIPIPICFSWFYLKYPNLGGGCIRHFIGVLISCKPRSFLNMEDSLVSFKPQISQHSFHPHYVTGFVDIF